MKSRDVWTVNGSNRFVVDDLVTAFAEIESVYQRFDRDATGCVTSNPSEDILNAVFLYLRYKTDFFDNCESQEALEGSVMDVLKTHSNYHFFKKPAILGEPFCPVLQDETSEVDPHNRDYRFKGTLESTEKLLQLIDGMETYDRTWITPDACIGWGRRSCRHRSSDWKHGVSVSVEHELRSICQLHIRGTSTRGLVEGLNLVFALPGKLSLEVTDECETSLNDIRPFLASNAIDAVYLMKDNALISREDSRALAQCSYINYLHFWRCRFGEDGGVSYVEEALERNTFPEYIRFEWHCPFAVNVLPRLLTCLPEETTLFLDHLTLENVVLPAPNIKALDMTNCVFEDGGYMAFPEAIRANRGPKELSIYFSEFSRLGGLRRTLGSSERCLSFMRALGTNSRLENLIVVCDGELDAAQIVAELSRSLQTNQGLRFLNVDFCLRKNDVNSGPYWKDLFESLSTHPTLRHIAFGSTNAYAILDFETYSFRSNRLRAVATYAAEMLQVNHRIERFNSCGNLYDRKIFDEKVTPALQVNILRKRLLEFRDAHVEPMVRAALLARIMGGSSSNPSLVWLTLQHNQASVVQHLLAPRRRVSPRRKKRRHIGGLTSS